MNDLPRHRLRQGVRGIILDEDDRVLLVRFDFQTLSFGHSMAEAFALMRLRWRRCAAN